MWLSWEDARIGGPAGLATWWRDIGDYHMGVLTSKDGPFWKCTNGRHEVPDLWESSPPEGMSTNPTPTDVSCPPQRLQAVLTFHLVVMVSVGLARPPALLCCRANSRTRFLPECSR